MPIVDAQLGRDSTDAPACCHLASSLASTSATNSPSRLGPRPTVHDALTSPARHDLAAQSVQRVPARTSVPCTALHTTMHGNEHTMPRHPRLAPWPIGSTQASPSSDAPELKPRQPRPNRYAIDSNTYATGLSAQCRPRTPPSVPNCIRSSPP
jgi:hypothetical protein